MGAGLACDGIPRYRPRETPSDETITQTVNHTFDTLTLTFRVTSLQSDLNRREFEL
jgi:hypothetical protein